MNVEQIQKRLDAMAEKMGAKGFRAPSTTIHINSHNKEVAVGAEWKDDTKKFPFNYAHDDDARVAFAKFEDWVDAQPSADERKMTEFMALVGKCIDLGRESGIQAEFVNPLTVLMKSLSENAITHVKEGRNVD